MFTNYPNGFPSGVTVRGVPLTQAYPGQVFWVGNATASQLQGHHAGADTGKGDFRSPFATLDYAVGRCTAGRGDIIFVKPGHAENIGAAAALALDVAGVAVIGLGSKAARPTFSWTAAAATATVTAANVTLANLRFVNNFADVVTMFSVSGAGDGLTIDQCLVTDTSTILNAIDFITLATGADGFGMFNTRMIGKSASNDSFITGVAHDDFIIDNSYLSMDVAQTGVVGLVDSTGNVTGTLIKDTFFRSNVDGASFVDFNGAANGGSIQNCYFSSIDTAGAVTAGIDFTGGHVFECYVAGEADSFGIVGGGTIYDNS